MPFAGGAQLAGGSFREPVGPHGGEHLTDRGANDLVILAAQIPDQ
jgi:hypothetical protein